MRMAWVATSRQTLGPRHLLCLVTVPFLKALKAPPGAFAFNWPKKEENMDMFCPHCIDRN